jgi:hypothetical protein
LNDSEKSNGVELNNNNIFFVNNMWVYIYTYIFDKHTMNEIVIDSMSEKREHTPPSSIDDENRKELLWEKREERLLLKWVEDMRKRSAVHDKLGRKNKILYSVFGIPSVLIPIVIGGLTPILECNTLVYSVGMIVTGLFTATNVFFNFSKKTHQHFESQKKMFELANDIETELSKPKRFRVECSVYMERIKLSYNLLI